MSNQQLSLGTDKSPVESPAELMARKNRELSEKIFGDLSIEDKLEVAKFFAGLGDKFERG